MRELRLLIGKNKKYVLASVWYCKEFNPMFDIIHAHGAGWLANILWFSFGIRWARTRKTINIGLTFCFLELGWINEN